MTTKTHKANNHSSKAAKSGDATPEEKRYQGKGTQAFFACAIITLLHYYFQPATIGRDKRYFIFIFLIPVIVGVILIGYYRREYLKKQFTDDKTFSGRAIMVVLYGLEGLFISFMSFGQIAGAAWDYADYTVAQHAKITTIECPIDNVYRTGSARSEADRVEFKLNDNSESLVTSSQVVDEYKDKKLDNYKLVINVHKGIWNYYMVKDWDIKKKQ